MCRKTTPFQVTNGSNNKPTIKILENALIWIIMKTQYTEIYEIQQKQWLEGIYSWNAYIFFKNFKSTALLSTLRI